MCVCVRARVRVCSCVYIYIYIYIYTYTYHVCVCVCGGGGGWFGVWGGGRGGLCTCVCVCFEFADTGENLAVAHIMDVVTEDQFRQTRRHCPVYFAAYSRKALDVDAAEGLEGLQFVHERLQTLPYLLLLGACEGLGLKV